MERTDDLAKRGFTLAICLVLALGLALRLLTARGDLALDEVWTLTLIQPLTSPWQIFWHINHDNNHYLNSLWLYAVGPAAPVRLQRGLSIAFGTLAIAAAGMWARPKGHIATLVTMALFTLSYGMVQYASEARGYAGLILCTLGAFILCEKVLTGRNTRWGLAAVCFVGMLCHFTMINTIGAIALWAVIVTRNPTRTLRLLWPAALCVAPVTLWVAYLVFAHRFTIGMASPFDAGYLLQSYGGAIRAMTGLPGRDIPSSYLIWLAIVLGAAIWQRGALGARFSLYLIAILAPPLVYWVFIIPNSDQPRYFLLSGIAYLLLLGDLAAIAWRSGQKLRLAALTLLLIFFANDSIYLYRLNTDGRGHYSAAVAAMTKDGPARYGTNDARRNTLLVDYYASKQNVSATYVPDSEWCAAPPGWYIAYSFLHDAPASEITVGPAACPHQYIGPVVYPYWGLSGFQWALYRRQ